LAAALTGSWLTPGIVVTGRGSFSVAEKKSG
jgi:hypothetical protein